MSPPREKAAIFVRIKRRLKSSANAPLVCITAIYFISRLVYYGAGVRFDSRGLGALVSSSRGVAYAWREREGVSWQKAAREAARDLRRAVNEALPIW